MRALALLSSGTARPGPKTFSRRTIIETAGVETELAWGRATTGKPVRALARFSAVETAARRGMGESGANSGHTEARAMLDVFVSVGTARFDVTWTNAAGDKERFRWTTPPLA